MIEQINELPLSTHNRLISTCYAASGMVSRDGDVDVVTVLSPGDLVVRAEVNGMVKRRELNQSQKLVLY